MLDDPYIDKAPVHIGGSMYNIIQKKMRREDDHTDGGDAAHAARATLAQPEWEMSDVRCL